jgi:hypothetical protein
MFRSLILPTLIVPFCVTSLFSAPKIEFNSKTFLCDTVIEGKMEKLKAEFVAKNTGNELLKITSIRPGCGCTNVKYDSLIKPGKSSRITAEVNIKGYRAGNISKSMVVSSNAENEKEVRLYINATITAIVELADQSIIFGGSDTTKTRTVTLASKKHDLNVTDVYLLPGGTPLTPGWQTEARLPMAYTWRPMDSLRADGARIFKLDLTAPKVTSSVLGETVIKTNHPEKQELRLQTEIVAK